MRHPASFRLFAAILLCVPATGSAQIDPLLFLKSSRPHVLVALDLSSRMQRDHLGRYYDPVVFELVGESYETALGLDEGNAESAYRRRYTDLSWFEPAATPRAAVTSVEAIGDRDPLFGQFDALTLLGRVRAGLRKVVGDNRASSRFGLITTRRANPRLTPQGWPIVATTLPGSSAATDTGTPGQWRAGIPVVDGPGGTASGPAPPVVAADSSTANDDLLRLLALRPGASGGLLPAGFDRTAVTDAPIALLLDDLRAEAARLVSADTRCCNTVALLIAAGGDPASSESQMAETADAFLAIAGRRVPVHVVALAPTAGEAAQLRALAAHSGGRYTEISGEDLGRAGSDIVPAMVAAFNAAVQHAFAAFADLNVRPSPAEPTGHASFFATAPPVVATVNLENALDAVGQPLPDTRAIGPRGEVLPQRENVLVTAGFDMPGFLGRLSAFRVYRPVADASRPTGYRFSADGTRLWTAAVPPPDQRNIFAALPGGTLLPLRVGSTEGLAPYLGVADPASLIETIRALPLGAIVNSTPALLHPPSGAFADLDYVAFAGQHRNRRTLVFVGADDGMMHAIDARTGIEVWAVVPFNLLPKLRLLREGQPIDAFPFFVDGSPRLADAKVLGVWRTFLLFGQGPGGTFYQAFDVTLDGVEDALAPDRDDRAVLLAWFSNPARITFRWSFPRYEQFDPAILPCGDVRASATEAEKSVGETWSTPVVGRAGRAGGTFVAIVGSGPLPRSRERQSNRGGTRAGTRLYMLDLASGALLDSRDVGSDGVAESQDGCAEATCSSLKNALQADALAAGPDGGEYYSRVYQGDLDGRLWRFDLSNGPGLPGFSGAPRLLLSAGADQPIFGSVAVLAGSAGQAYLFLGTGSDLLPSGGAAGHKLLGIAEAAGGLSGQFERLLRSAGADGVEERLAGAPVVDGAVVFFATTSRVPGGSCVGPEAVLYALTITGGAAFDANGDRQRDGRNEAVLARVRSGRATPPVVAGRHLFLATGDRVQVFGDADGFDSSPGFLGLRILSWREVR